MPNIAVMLCTCNGERFLKKQIKSIAEQTITPLSVFVSDDGSSDQTLTIIDQSIVAYPQLKFQILSGPQQGFADNFLSIFNFESPQLTILLTPIKMISGKKTS